MERLSDQANGLRELLHHDTAYPNNATILEPGCGIGAQTLFLAQSSPNAQITSVDISPESLRKAQETISQANITNVTFQQGNIYELPFDDESFDHVFVCFVLEHLTDPHKALLELRRVLKTGGSLTAIEGDHGSCYWNPETPESIQAWLSLVKCQAELNADSLIGRRLYPLLNNAGLREIHISPRMVYIDSSKPKLMDSFVEKTIIPMVEGVHQQALESKMIDQNTWAKGINDLHLVASSPDGTFCYMFFKAFSIK
jgi:ubiquinone/menaquinone biosynthesis C-methylase UbiE